MVVTRLTTVGVALGLLNVTVTTTGWPSTTAGILIQTVDKITTVEDKETQPATLLTVKLYVPVANPVMVVDVVLPVTLPGLIVHAPAGSPLKTTLPVATVHVGCVMAPTVGAGDVSGWALMTTFALDAEVQPAALLTVKLYVPVANPVIVVDVVLPVTLPGLIVQFPAGSPLKTTLPVANVHVGWVMAPNVGAGDVSGWALMTTFALDADVQPAALLTVKLYAPVANPVIVVDVVLPVTLPGLIVQFPAGSPLKTTLPVDRKSTRLNSSHALTSRMPSSA